VKGWEEIKTGCELPRPGRYVVDRANRRYLHVGCNRWRCKGCARRKRARVVKRFALLEPNWLLTLTIADNARATPTLANLAWLHDRRRALFRWFARRPWGLLKQGWVPELGEENGRLHMHCAIRMRSLFLPFSEIQRVAKRLGLGAVDFQQVFRADGATRYMAKYMAKGVADSLGLERARRFGMTPGHTLPKNPDWALAERSDALPTGSTRLALILPFVHEQCTFADSSIYAVPS
jgi:hypothetical protein